MFKLEYSSSSLGIFKDNNVIVVYKPNSQEIIAMPQWYYINHMSCIDSNYDYLSMTDSKSKIDSISSRNLMLRLLITNRCNLNCAYCQMKKLTKHSVAIDMSYEIIDKILVYVAKSNFDYITIHFSGGEPLIALDKINYVCQNVKKLGIRNVRFAISTNGTFLNDKTIALLKDNHIHTIVSIDGLGKANNKRLDFLQHESVKTVLQACRKATDSGLSLGISTVFVKENSEHAIELVDWLFNEYHIRSLGYNYQHYSGFEKGNIDTSSNYMDEYTKSLISVSNYCREHDIFEEQSNRLIEPLVFSKIRSRHCTSQSSQITVMPDGNVGPCKTFASAGKDTMPYLEWLEGHFDSILSKWRKRTIFTIEKCRNCLYRNICGGGCPYEAYVDTGEIMNSDLRYCSVPQSFLPAMLDVLNKKRIFDSIEKPKIITQKEKECLLTCKKTDIYGLTTSIGHMLEI